MDGRRRVLARGVGRGVGRLLIVYALAHTSGYAWFVNLFDGFTAGGILGNTFLVWPVWGGE
jgi:hypothetical protein